MADSSKVIIYRYDASPFSVKIDNVLFLKGIAHHRVDVAMVLPRPEITDLLGLGYRRLPILAIGNDIYCNTSLIAAALERRFPASKGYGTIFPAKQNGKTDTAMIKAFSQFYADQNVFPPAADVLPWERLPSGLVKDRSAFRDAQLDPAKLAASRPRSISLLSSHLSVVEEQLSDGRQWLFETSSPSLADLSLHFIFSWIRPMKTTQGLFDQSKFPRTIEWLDRLSKLLKDKSESVSHAKITADEAAKSIASSSFESYEKVGFDEMEAKRLGLTPGCIVDVAPTDTGRTSPTRGKLVALNREELTIEIMGQAGTFRVHFPRLEFSVRLASKSKL